MPSVSVVNLTIQVDNLSAVLQLYDHIQVWRSVSGINGTYVEITSDIAEPAELVSTLSGPYALNGKTLNIVMNGADPISIVFSETDPVPLSLVLAHIEAVMPGVASLTADNHLQLVSLLPGTGSSLRVTGNAAAVLGISTSLVGGTGARMLMGNITSTYVFADLAGDPTFYYKTRFYSRKTKAVSVFSAPQIGNSPVSLPDRLLTTCVVNLIDITGAPIAGRRIILVSVQSQNIPYNNLTYGLLPGNDRIELTTDGDGHAETSLVQGATLRAFFEGSGFSREFVVPEDDFDLLTVLSTESDPFDIVQSPPMPIRES